MKKTTFLASFLLFIGCSSVSTTENLPQEKTASQYSNLVLLSTTTKIPPTYNSDTDTYSFGANLAEYPVYDTKNLLYQLSNSFNSLKLEFEKNRYVVVVGNITDRQVVPIAQSNESVYALIFEDKFKLNGVYVVLNDYQKNSFDIR